MSVPVTIFVDKTQSLFSHHDEHEEHKEILIKQTLMDFLASIFLFVFFVIFVVKAPYSPE